jgi:ParB-like chromosome segregation protein Spo0J
VFEIVLPLSEIKVDASIQCRASINRTVVSEYAQRIKAGDIFPPLDLFDIDGEKCPVDGFHRIEAAKEAGRESISVRIHQGTRKDAVRYAIAANRAHGLRFSNKDKHKAVELALQELPDKSDGAIAEMVGVSQPFVSKLSRELKTVLGSAGGPKVGRDGRKRSTTSRKQNAKAKATSQSATARQDHATATGKRSAQEKAGKDAEAGRNSTKEDDKSQFDLRTSLRRIKKFLLTESEQCPEHLRVQFWEELEKFTTNHSQSL